MTPERPILTPEEYARAEKREGVHHPVIDVLDHQLPRIAQLNH